MLFDQAPKYLFLGLIAASLALGLFGGSTQSGRAFLPIGMWWLFTIVNWAASIGLMFVAFRESTGWGIAWLGAIGINYLLAHSGLGYNGGGISYLPLVLFVIYYVISRWRLTFPWIGLHICNGLIFGLAVAGMPDLRQQVFASARQHRAAAGNGAAPDNVFQGQGGGVAGLPPGVPPPPPGVRVPAPQPESTVTLEVTGLSDPDAEAYFDEKLRETRAGNSLSTGGGGRKTYTIWPVDDPKQFAARITWATVTRVDGRTVHVTAKPVPANERRPADTDFVAQILFDLKSPKKDLCRQALQRLQNAPPDETRQVEVAKAIEPILKDPDGFTRVDAVKALKVWGGKENVPALLNALKDPEGWVVRASLETLALWKDPTTIEPIGACLETDDRRDEAAKALRQFGSSAEPEVIKHLRSGNDWTRVEAANILKEIGTEACVPALQELVLRRQNQGLDCMAAGEVLNRLGAPLFASQKPGNARKSGLVPRSRGRN